ncbi:MAG: sigma 54-interacting transcriptional regulator [Clostridium sp.]|jgi:transcriptional regulatory protein LevR/transcriptional regulator with AAA-type ATPase domain|uniref:sigma-54-dependent transcriptional regulator n=1 Tax=Clostridium sp. TaxID=1506 RepID=UPI0025C1B74A|nr:sigma-54-dependent transcriptional regulator [Clostridium sp.]MCH3965914.1 sigma 54-interacting transcriptional regulator [Clostridium sp.]MCI1715997.1 sigma 54-interacting transcriptional regulator [Clostridium sp.]MCI1800331.1 sigma 54-interacting transcriptional regulator [Clostridium sp.]MCI1814174.1 sigma 54-interacting transcriptional regulator [Clostridium sp.]MCI1871073.1 sigma 54-interacting transcriptional regulator [Clostridium sp.]
MKRIDRIHNYLIERTLQLDINSLKGKVGFSAKEISDELGILRNNVSMELNILLKQDKVIKIIGRPVLFIDKSSLEDKLQYNIEKGPLEVDSIDSIIKDNGHFGGKKSPFDNLIGFETGLKNQVEQAKAAILYPPNGLHTLIVGQTGVGKTLFANMMYNYARYVKRFDDNSPFVIFNCADYYNNSQLLISHIFGHLKGAFTGADKEKEGLVERADGGMLFLDEIHRLPPEGQEMIFYFMDTGTYNKLGETERRRKSNVFIVCATTEDPDSSLLRTFVRRIPIIISIPSLNERPAEDKINILKYLISNEAHRINKPIKIEENAVKALIGSVSYGNIGQMKSNIQLVCAKGFLNSIENSEYVEIDFKLLPPDIKKGLFLLGARRNEMEEISKYVNSQLIVAPEGYKVLIDEDPYEPPFNLYKIIEDKAIILKDEGLDDDSIKDFIATDINVHIKGFYDKFKDGEKDRKKILKVVDENVLEFADEIRILVQKRLDRKLSDRFLYALSLHLSAFFKRIESGRPVKYTNISSIIKDNPREYDVSLEIKKLIEKRYSISVPKMEVIYLTLLLSSIQDEQNDGNVAIIVAAHGNSTATSMVNVAKKLLGDCNMQAIDMPLEVNPEDILDKMIKRVQEIDMGKGVLLLVDMGSLANFDTVIIEKTGIDIKTIDMVSTPLVLEAVRKANIFDMDLDRIYESLKGFRGYSMSLKEKGNQHANRAFVTICSSGEGTAVKLEELVEDVIHNITDERIDVIPVGLKNLKDSIKTIQNKYEVMACIGIVNPKMDIPFISLESLINGCGEKIIGDIVASNTAVEVNEGKSVVVEDLCRDSLGEFLTYLNPSKIISVLIDFISVLEKRMNTHFKNSLCIKLIVHTGCALERMIVKEGLIYRDDKSGLDVELVNILKDEAGIFKSTLNIELTDDEIYYISEMLR